MIMTVYRLGSDPMEYQYVAARSMTEAQAEFSCLFSHAKTRDQMQVHEMTREELLTQQVLVYDEDDALTGNTQSMYDALLEQTGYRLDEQEAFLLCGAE